MAINNDDFLAQMLKAQALLQKVATLEYQQQTKQLVLANDNIKLHHYQPKKNTSSIPLLIIFATINQADILDLHPRYSFIKRLLDEGQDIYLLEWLSPAGMDIGIGHYVCDYMNAAVKFILKEHHLNKLNMLGVCQGGLFSLCYAALHDTVNKLILLTTPVDFHANEHVIAKLLSRVEADLVEQNIPGAWLTNFFISLRPFDLIGKKYFNLLNHLDDDNYIDQFLLVEKWLKNAPDQAMLAIKQLIQDFYQQNKLIKSEFYLNNNLVQLRNIKADIFNIIAEQDDIVIPAMSYALKHYISANQYTEQSFATGHIGIYLNKNISNELALVITKWLAGKY